MIPAFVPVLGFGKKVGGGAPAEVPVNLTPPTISGPNTPPQVGDTLTCAHGAWSNSPTLFSYFWTRCDADGLNCSDLLVADAPTCVLAGDALGYTIRCSVLAVNAVGPALDYVQSAATEVVMAAFEITTIDFTGLTQESFLAPGFPAKGFLISNLTQRLGFYGVVADETMPSFPGADDYFPALLTTATTDTEIASAFAAAIGDGHGFTAVQVGDTPVIVVTDNEPGTREDAVDVDSGVVITVTHQGADGPSGDPLAEIDFAARLQTHNGDNVPLGLWQDVSCTIPATEEEDSIAAWSDELSASGIVVTQSNALKQPLLSFVGGVPTVIFDGVDDYLSAAFTLTQPCVAAVAGEYTSSVASNATLIDGFSPGNNMRLYRSGTLAMGMYAGDGLPTTPATPEDPHCYYCEFDGSSSTLAFDNDAPATMDTGTNAAGGLTIGAWGGVGEYGSVAVVAVLLHQGLLTDTDPETVKNYLADILS